MVSKKSNKKNFFFIFFFTFLNWEKTDMVLGKRWLFSIGNGAKIRSLEKDRKSTVKSFDLRFIEGD